MEVLKTAPAVFSVGNEYQIMVPVREETLMSVKVGDKKYYDHSNGIIRSKVAIHRMTVPAAELDREKKYSICYRKVIDRKPYFPDVCEEEEVEFEFCPVGSENITVYHISDAHNFVAEPIAAAKKFEQEIAEIDLLILNGDIPNHSGEIENFDVIYEIAGQITGGKKPVIYSRGNHDTRGIYAENIAEYTPCNNGNSYFSFRAGGIWGVVIDCGEDKNDDYPEYGHTVCCHPFREAETEFLEKLMPENEYGAEGVTHKIVVSHVPFTRKLPEPFDIEQEIYTKWAKILKETVKPELMLCGHLHRFFIDMPGGPADDYGQPCPVVVGSVQHWKDGGYFAGAGYIFREGEVEVIFNDNEKIIERNIIKV